MSSRRPLTLIVGSSQVAWIEMTTLQVFIWTREGIFALSQGNSTFIIITVKMNEEGREGRRQRTDVKRDVSCSPMFICNEWVMKNWYSTCSTGHDVLVQVKMSSKLYPVCACMAHFMVVFYQSFLKLFTVTSTCENILHFFFSTFFLIYTLSIYCSLKKCIKIKN